MANGKSVLVNSDFWSILLIGLVLIQVSACRNFNSKESLAARVEIPDSSVFHSGDLVFRTGRDLMAKMVLFQGDSSHFSHVGLIAKMDRRVMVIHALPESGKKNAGVLVEPISDFFSLQNASAGSVYRLKNISLEQEKIIIEFATHQIGAHFDDEFRYSDSNRFYCTELVLKAMAAAGKNFKSKIPSINLLTVSEPVVLPDNLRFSKQLQKIVDIHFSK